MNRIKELRKELNLSQVELASQLHISQQAIQQYESDRNYPSADILIRLSDIFSTSVDYLLGCSDIRERYVRIEMETVISHREMHLLQRLKALSSEEQELLLKLLKGDQGDDSAGDQRDGSAGAFE